MTVGVTTFGLTTVGLATVGLATVCLTTVGLTAVLFHLNQSQLAQLRDAIVGGLALEEELASSHRLRPEESRHPSIRSCLKSQLKLFSYKFNGLK